MLPAVTKVMIITVSIDKSTKKIQKHYKNGGLTASLLEIQSRLGGFRAQGFSSDYDYVGLCGSWVCGSGPGPSLHSPTPFGFKV